MEASNSLLSVVFNNVITYINYGWIYLHNFKLKDVIDGIKIRKVLGLDELRVEFFKNKLEHYRQRLYLND